MLCKKPYRKGVLEYGCGQCMPCRVNRSRIWTARMLLESAEHAESCFVTLTYNDENLPKNGSLCPKDLTLFMKRLRHSTGPFRYYAVGEYGDKSWRPHFHLILFGVGVSAAVEVEKAWSYGYTLTGTAERSSMSYVASYVMKKMTNPKDRRLNGRYPEFSRMSLRPGLGYGVVERISSAYSSVPGRQARERDKWIAERIRIDGKKYSLGRYLREKIIEKCGFSEDEKYDHKCEVAKEVFAKKSVCSTTEYERGRAARLIAQDGMLNRKGVRTI